MPTPPYDIIQENADRSWSLNLLERLKLVNIPDEERGEIIWTLERLDDPRCLQPLYDTLTDPDYPKAIREAAGLVLLYSGIEPPPGQVDRWWHSNDEILRRQALSNMGPEHSDIVERIANDPTHPLHVDAIGTLAFGFEMPRHQELKIKGLSHPNPEVRETAANALLWDEPIRAEHPLIEATHDSAPEVAEAACSTLAYYPTHKVLHRLAEVRSTHPDAEVRAQAQASFEELRWRFGSGLMNPNNAAHIRGWLAPVWDVLAYTPDELELEEDDAPPAKRAAHQRRETPIEEIGRHLDNPDGSRHALRDLFSETDWSAIAPRDRKALTERFVTHPDRLVRDEAAKVLAGWGDQRTLLNLLADNDILVRKSAMYWLGETEPPSPEVAALAREHLSRPDVYGMHASETLQTFTAHARPEEARSYLAAIVEGLEHTENLRTDAVYHLQELDSRLELAALMKFVEQDPLVTWSLHAALLESAGKLDLTPPDLSRYRSADHIDIQEAIAPFV